MRKNSERECIAVTKHIRKWTPIKADVRTSQSDLTKVTEPCDDKNWLVKIQPVVYLDDRLCFYEPNWAMQNS